MKRVVDDEWIQSTALVFCLVSLLLGIWLSYYFLWVTALLLLLLIFFPRSLYPVGFAWLVLSEVLAYVMNRIFFGAVFLLVVTPIGLIRKLFVKDTMVLFGGREQKTAFHERIHILNREDFIRPF